MLQAAKELQVSWATRCGFNMLPEQLMQLMAIRIMCGELAIPMAGIVVCGSTLDYAIISPLLSARIHCVRIGKDYPSSPHKPFEGQLSMRVPAMQQTVQDRQPMDLGQAASEPTHAQTS